MKKSADLIRPLLRAAAATLLAGFVVLHAEEPKATKEQTAKPATAELKNNFLFMGANLQVVHKGKTYPVVGLNGDSYGILVGDKKQWVKVDPEKVLFKRSFKLGDRAVRVENLNSRQGYYTADGNKILRGGIAMSTVSGAEGMQYVAESAMEGADAAAGSIMTDEANLPVYSYDVPRAEVDTAYAAAGSSYASSLGLSEDAGRDAKNNAFIFPEKPEAFSVDAIGISCSISSPVTLKNAYVIAVIRYAVQDKPEEEKSVFLSRELPEIGQKPYAFELKQGGLPRGYLLKGVQLHIYDGGRELASNVAARMVALTEADAHAFLVIEYAAQNKGRNLPARPIMKKYTASVKARLGEERYNKPLFVRVSKLGLVTGVFSDESCAQKADADLEALLNRWRFLPALDKGLAVEGVAQVRISDTSL